MVMRSLKKKNEYNNMRLSISINIIKIHYTCRLYTSQQ